MESNTYVQEVSNLCSPAHEPKLHSMEMIAVVGLGYVGLPLAVAFGRLMPTLGYDLSQAKVVSFQNHIDPSGTVTAPELRAAVQLKFSTDPAGLAQADFIVIAVPTPLDNARKPDFAPLIHASESVGAHLKPGATVIYESTVYPGATEEVCIPVLERASGLKWQRDFFVGYSPERINPGDQQHTLANTVKVVAGDCPDTLARVAALYEKVVGAGVHRVSSLKVAEAAKVIENTQRDLNIALMNELAVNVLGHHEQVKAGAEKIVTKNGESFIALIDSDRLDYYHQLERERIHLLLINEVSTGLDDVAAGRVKDADSAIQSIKRRRSA